VVAVSLKKKDAEIERLSELADREELSKWLQELGAEDQPAPQEHGPEQRKSFRRAAALLLSPAPRGMVPTP